MTFDQVATFIIVLLAIAGGINVIGSAIKVIKEWIKPIGANNARIGEIEKHVDNDNKRLNELEESNRLLLRGINVLIDAKLDGNHVEELKQVQGDIAHYLINR